MLETELFDPVREYLEAEGFAVAAEVRHCDIVAAKDDHIVIIELKTSLNLTLVSQAVQRQSVADEVYVAIPEPKRITKTLRHSQKVLKRLGLGLLTVSTGPLRSIVQCRITPDFSGRINKKERQRIIKEMNGRSLQLNTGGATGIPIVTAYRETAITLATLLSLKGPRSIRELKPIAGEKTGTILYKNHYGWFVREARGIYGVTERGCEELSTYPELVGLAKALADNLD